jgi:hypothetical protein
LTWINRKEAGGGRDAQAIALDDPNVKEGRVGSENSIHRFAIAGESEHDCWMFAIAFLFVRVLRLLQVATTA